MSLYDAYNLTQMNAHDLMGLWDTFVYPSSRQSDKIRSIRWLWSSKKTQQCQSSKKSAFILSQSALLSLSLSLSVTHTQLCITHHPIAVMFRVATSFWCWFICDSIAFMRYCVCMNISRYELCLTAVTLDGRPSFSLSKCLTHTWTSSAVCQRKLPQTTRVQLSWSKAINTVTLWDLM